MLVSRAARRGVARAGGRPRGRLRHHRRCCSSTATPPRCRSCRPTTGRWSRCSAARLHSADAMAVLTEMANSRRRAPRAAAGSVRRRLRRRRQLGQGAPRAPGRRCRSAHPTTPTWRWPAARRSRRRPPRASRRPPSGWPTRKIPTAPPPARCTPDSPARTPSWRRSTRSDEVDEFAPTEMRAADEGNKPFLLVGSALTSIFVVGVVALVISLAISIRPTADQRPSPGAERDRAEQPGARPRGARAGGGAGAGSGARRPRPSSPRFPSRCSRRRPGAADGVRGKARTRAGGRTRSRARRTATRPCGAGASAGSGGGTAGGRTAAGDRGAERQWPAWTQPKPAGRGRASPSNPSPTSRRPRRSRRRSRGRRR